MAYLTAAGFDSEKYVIGIDGRMRNLEVEAYLQSIKNSAVEPVNPDVIQNNPEYLDEEIPCAIIVLPYEWGCDLLDPGTDEGTLVYELNILQNGLDLIYRGYVQTNKKAVMLFALRETETICFDGISSRDPLEGRKEDGRVLTSREKRTRITKLARDWIRNIFRSRMTNKSRRCYFRVMAIQAFHHSDFKSPPLGPNPLGVQFDTIRYVALTPAENAMRMRVIQLRLQKYYRQQKKGMLFDWNYDKRSIDDTIGRMTETPARVRESTFSRKRKQEEERNEKKSIDEMARMHIVMDYMRRSRMKIARQATGVGRLEQAGDDVQPQSSSSFPSYDRKEFSPFRFSSESAQYTGLSTNAASESKGGYQGVGYYEPRDDCAREIPSRADTICIDDLDENKDTSLDDLILFEKGQDDGGIKKERDEKIVIGSDVADNGK